jgi:hypothetical protein
VHIVSFVIRIYHDARSSECQKFVTAYTRTCYLSLSWAKSIQSMLPSYFLTFVLILSFHLLLCLPSCLFHSGFLTQSLYTPFLSPIRATCPRISFFSIWSPEKFWWGVFIIKILIMQFSAPPVTSSLLGPNILFSTLFLDSQTPSAYVSPSMRATKFHTHTKQQTKL